MQRGGIVKIKKVVIPNLVGRIIFVVINKMIDTIQTKDILILDEPTDGFSTDQLDKLRNVLNELKLNQIIIVSHEQKMDAYVDNIIRMHKDNHVSRIIRDM